MNILWNRTSIDPSVETKGIHNAIWGKRRMKLVEFTTKVSKFPFSSIFDNIVPILHPFRNFTSIRKLMGSRLKRLATGSVSKRYQTSLSAQLSKTILENVHFDHICQVFNF